MGASEAVDGSRASLGFELRPARTTDVRAIKDLVEAYTDSRRLLAKATVTLYEDVQEFLVAVGPDGELIGCGALHVMWEDLAEVRTLAVAPGITGSGIGGSLLDALLARARALGSRGCSA